MEIFKDKVQIANNITLGGKRMVLFAGPCAAESFDICYETGAKVKELCKQLDIDYVFKSCEQVYRGYYGNTKDGGRERTSF